MRLLHRRFALATVCSIAALILCAVDACAQSGASEMVSLISNSVVTLIAVIALLLSAGGWIATWRQYGTRIANVERTLFGTGGRQDGEVSKRQGLEADLKAHREEHKQLVITLGLEIRAALAEFRAELARDARKG